MDNNLALTKAATSTKQKPKGRKSFFKLLVQQRALVLMSIPFVIWVIIFKYLPIWGWAIAFQDYKPAKSFWEQEWVGFEHFKFLFTNERFLLVLRNTIVMSLINLVLGFVTAISLALMLNEVRNMAFKRTVQTISYMPYFLSWVVAAGIIQNILAVDGVVNDLLKFLGLIEEGKEILFLGIGEWFWGIYGASIVWKNVGWNTIVYLAAIAVIDPGLYEAAEIDGAGRFRKMWHITLPGIRNVIIVLLIMNIGYLLESGFEPQYLLGNGMNIDYSENLDIFVLNYGIRLYNYSLSVAASIFKTVVSFILITAANNIAKRIGEVRLY